MTSEKDCGDWETKSEHEVNEHFRKNIGRCHICRGDFIENSFVNWHPKECTACHNECRLELSQFEPTPEPRQEPRQEPTPEKNKTYSVAEKKLTYPRAYDKWDKTDDEALEEMWKSGKSIKEIAEKLGRTEGAIEYRIRIKQIDVITGRPMPVTEWQKKFLVMLGYDDLNPDEQKALDDRCAYNSKKDAKITIDKMRDYPPCQQLINQLEVRKAHPHSLGTVTSDPKTNQEALTEIEKLTSATEYQKKKVLEKYGTKKIPYAEYLELSMWKARQLLAPESIAQPVFDS